jgi:hypothetical protein
MSITRERLEQLNKQARVIAVISAERDRQDKLKAEGRFKYTCADDGMDDWERLGCIMEEVGEVSTLLLNRIDPVKRADGHDACDISDTALLKELSQIAALSAAWMERLVDGA